MVAGAKMFHSTSWFVLFFSSRLSQSFACWIVKLASADLLFHPTPVVLESLGMFKYPQFLSPVNLLFADAFVALPLIYSAAQSFIPVTINKLTRECFLRIVCLEKLVCFKRYGILQSFLTCGPGALGGLRVKARKKTQWLILRKLSIYILLDFIQS